MKSDEKKRMLRLLLAFAAVLGAAGITRPWEKQRKVRTATHFDAGDAGFAGVAEEASAPADARTADLLLQFVHARRTPAASRPSRDPFFLPEETAAGAALAATWKAKDAAASRSAVATSPVDARPAISPELVEGLRRLRLFGTVGSPESGAAVVEGIGRVSVGATVPGTPFVLRSIGPGVAVFAAGDVVIELSTPRPQGGSATSEKK